MIFQGPRLSKQQQARPGTQAVARVRRALADGRTKTTVAAIACDHLVDGDRDDFILAYHLMDFSRYFFDQSNIRRSFFL